MCLYNFFGEKSQNELDHVGLIGPKYCFSKNLQESITIGTRLPVSFEMIQFDELASTFYDNYLSGTHKKALQLFFAEN